MSNSKPLSPTEVVARCGGTTAFARRVGVSPGRVSNWRRRDEFPVSGQNEQGRPLGNEIIRAAAECGIYLTPANFGLRRLG